MIVGKIKLLISLILLTVCIQWAPALWRLTETGGLHWLLIRLPLALTAAVGIYLFIKSIRNASDEY